MSNIGYAVFGTPKGISVISNGVFKELNLDKSLYLNNSEVELSKGQRVLMIRRIATDSNNRDKNGLLVALYENALQHGENRPGGFVGSAICFKDKMPNAEKMMAGLFYLFNEMKKNVDSDSRFKSLDSSTWNVNLPDTNKEFGMFENSKLPFFPFSQKIKGNQVVSLNSLEKDSIPLLTNLCLNPSFHNVEYVYATNYNEVLRNMINKGFSKLDFSTLFNYNEIFAHYTNQINVQKIEIQKLNTEIVESQNKHKGFESNLNTIKSEISSKENHLKTLNADLLNIQKQLESKKIIPKRKSNQAKGMSNDDFIADIYQDIKAHSSFKADDSNKQKNEVFRFFKEMPERKKKAQNKTIAVLGGLMALLLLFVGLFIWKTTEASSLKDKNIELSKKINNEEVNNLSGISEEPKLEHLLEDLNTYSKPADYKKFREKADILLTNYLDGTYEEDSKEVDFIKNQKWMFWQFDYKNEAIIKKLGLNSSKYFTNIEKEIKPLKGNLKFLDGDISTLNAYIEKQDNDIYQNVDSVIINDKELLEDHFRWVFEKCNGKSVEDESVKKGTKIKLPFFNK